ncbi:MFS-type transporter [Penicillium ucsense]|uniref:MFS-type transporter n=1 Tax=Penicillium ucsense TaxID=2839758 RepID=A0A8J8WAE5_9EURO|nr:MFS-type transporter [Penicillium ucsense]KAF7736207.1 MFS-type transporter [Penicillium ucsense]
MADDYDSSSGELVLFSNDKDSLEKAEQLENSLQDYLQGHKLELTCDRKFIRWGRDNPKHPRNWSKIRKLFDTSVICALDLFVTASSTAGSAAATQAKDEFHLNQTISTFCFVTLFLLGQSIGTIVFPPWSEAFGRKKTYLFSAALSSICCLVIGLVHSLTAAIVMRFVAGLLSAVPGTILGGSIEDMFNSKARIWVIFFWTVASNIGLIIGPITSSYIIELLDWRWMFHIYAIVIGSITALLFVIRESRSSYILTGEVDRLRKTVPALPPALNHDHSPDLQTFVRDALFRPAQLFCQEPIIFTIAMMISVAMSLIYIFTEALQPIYQTMGFSASQSSLIFLSLGIGTCLSAFTRILDCYIFNRRRAQGKPIRPEDKLMGLAIGAPFLAIGLWWFGWTIPPKASGSGLLWVAPTLSLVFVGYALTELDTVLYGYISDSYLSYSASATAAVAFLRGILSGTFPLFTRQMFAGLGANMAVSVLAIVATVFCIVPPLFLCYGEKIRKRSRFAKYSWEIQEELGNDDSDM